MPSTMGSILVLSTSSVLRRQVREHLEIKGIKFDFVSSSAELITTCNSKTKLCCIDIGFFKSNLFMEVKALRKAIGQTPIFAFGSPTKTKNYSIRDLHNAGVDEYFERTDVWNSPSILTERMKTYVREDAALKKENANPVYRDFAAILIGASTGGPQVLKELLVDFPSQCPPVVVVQHIEPKFAETFFWEMCNISGLEKGKITAGEPLKSGRLYMATGDFNIGVKKSRDYLTLSLDHKKKIGRHRPSVDFLFNSATAVDDNFCAILLTGLGADGSRTMAALKKNGSYTMVQDKESSPVFGMPEEAIKIGAAIFVGNPQEMRRDLFKRL